MMAISTPQRAAEAAQVQLQSPPSRTRKERGFQGVLFLATVVAVIVLAVLLVDVLLDGSGRLLGGEGGFPQVLASYRSRFPDRTGYLAGLTGTLSLMVLVAAISFPLGVGAALYLEEFAPRNRATRLLEANIANLAGVPSVVYGLLGAGVFVAVLGFGRSLISGALTLTLLILPVIIVAGREALRSVPRAIRDGGLALGATPLQVAFRQTLPAALPGILTGTILALSRAIGETAPLLVVGAAGVLRTASVPWRPGEQYTALPVEIYRYVSFPQDEFRVAVASAGILVLLAVLLVMNSAAILLRNKYSRSW